ncbi:hypothetical protein Tco_1570946 [Tanacetum coccineum]
MKALRFVICYEDDSCPQAANYVCSRSHRDNEEQVFVSTTCFLTSVAMNVSTGKISDITVTDLVSLKGYGRKEHGPL